MANSFVLNEITDTILESTIASVDISSNVSEWTPASPGLDDDTVVESIELINMSFANWEKIENLLNRAQSRAETGYGNRVYFYADYEAASGRAAYRSEIYDGKLLMNVSNLKEDTANGTFSGTLVIKRDGWWEATTDTALTLTNDNGSGTSLRIYNCNDLSGTAPNKRNNYVNISGGAGIRKAPLKFTLTMNMAGPVYVSNVIAGIINNQALVHHVEGTGGTSVADGNSSGGYFQRFALTSTMATVFSYLNVGGNRGGYQSHYFMVAVRFANDPPADTYVQTYMHPDGYTGPVVKLTASKFQIVDVVQLPQNYRIDQYKALYIQAKGSGNLDVDYVTLIPTDSFVRIPVTKYMSAGHKFVIDTRLGVANYDDVVGGVYAIPYIGPGLFLESESNSGSASKMVVAYSTGSDGTEMVISYYCLAEASIRPRIITL